MVKKGVKILLPLLLIIGCASISTSIHFYSPILADLKTENYATAVSKIDQARQNGKYAKKDRVLFYLDKGVTQYYSSEYQKSNTNLETAEKYMEELFTKSISKAALSFVLNDNALDYYGEVYENLYINIFKALNYINLNQFDEAYVEVNRVNDKLRELDVKYGNLIKNLNESEDSKIKIESESSEFSSDVLSHYLSYIIYRADGEEDNSRISHNKMVSAWQSHPDVYNFPVPKCIKEPPRLKGDYFNVIAFTGNAPYKKPVGAKITTYEDAIGIHGVDIPIATPNIPFPGSKPGFHFKFSFPVMRSSFSNIARIEVFVDNQKAGDLDLLEDLGKVAIKTFNTKRKIIYIKTVVRTVLKGLAAAEAKKKLKKEAKANKFWGAVMDGIVDIGVDATENPDLRSWRMMPHKCYVGEFRIGSGQHDIEVRFYSKNNLMVKRKSYPNYTAKNKLNLLDVVSLN